MLHALESRDCCVFFEKNLGPHVTKSRGTRTRTRAWESVLVSGSCGGDKGKMVSRGNLKGLANLTQRDSSLYTLLPSSGCRRWIEVGKNHIPPPWIRACRVGE
jgi:hypothetical protein